MTYPSAQLASISARDRAGAGRDHARRHARTVTVVEGVKLPPSGLEIARALRHALGCGASVEGATIVVQGDMAARLEPWLRRRGVPHVAVGS